MIMGAARNDAVIFLPFILLHFRKGKIHGRW